MDNLIQRKRKKIQPSMTGKKKANKLLLQGELQVEPQYDQDRLSSLPEPLLVSILSLLDINYAASTSALSHRWRYLWTQLTHLRFPYYNSTWREKALSFYPTVDRIFEQLTSDKIYSFTLHFPCLGHDDDTEVQLCESALEKWLGRLCALNVEELSVSSRTWPPKDYSVLLPSLTFQWRSLVELAIIDGFRLKLPDDGVISLPNLKTLRLRSSGWWDCETMSKLLKSCPVLEVLFLCIHVGKQAQSMDISCQNLRSLTLSVQHPPIGWHYTISAPRLEIFEVNGLVSSFRFVENPCLLTKAKIMWQKLNDVDVGVLDQMSAFFQGICSIQALEITGIVLTPLVHLDNINKPTFHNLSELRITLDDTYGWNNVLYCLHCTPNLEVLLVDKYLPGENVKRGVAKAVPVGLSSKLKKIELKYLEGNNKDLKFLMYILKNANALEWLQVCLSSNNTIQQCLRFYKKLLNCHRISTDCVIDFRGAYFHRSSAHNHIRGTLKCEIQPLG